ncbi:unnamed protein product [Didymodactylos carnosus]|uniref:Uncharacterized protein n=1 Tax=Didymodactylos carnosus TaxID=1234261 RepID=A0A8S2F465_9BILA|nr:unnamed protein product [Didymodactylos carnosus]CAF4128322.1 unnamed protein product [Didymodactylos carnosus]
MVYCRRGVWESNVGKIRQHNLEADLGVHTFTMKMNKYGDMPHEEFVKKMNGLKTNIHSSITDFDSHNFVKPSNVKIPAAVDWRKEGYVTEVKDQGQCGGSMALSFLYIKENKGIDIENTYPYEAMDGRCRFNKQNVGANDTGFVQIKHFSETDLETAIATVGPVSVSIDASRDSFQFYSTGVYNEPTCSSIKLDHGVLAVGYDTYKDTQDYYIVKNSWGKGWGDEGYIWMSRNKKNQCGIASDASYPLV